MQGHGEKLSRKQEQAIAALLTAPTIGAAAQGVGVNEATLWRWLQREDFQQAYRAARREAVSQAIAAVQQAACEAVRTLEDVMADSEAPASSRVSAAKTLLELALKTAELEDFDMRLAAVEAALATLNPRRTLQ